MIEHQSSFDFATTLQRLTDAIAKAGLTIFAQIDHAAGAQSAGLQMLPATVLIYGNARGGTPIMQAVPAAALDLPLRVLVREDTAEKTSIAFHPVVEMLAQAGVAESLAERLQPAQNILVGAIS